MLDRKTASDAADRLKVFAQPQRLMILTALIGRELAVGGIDAETGIGQPALSQKLAELRRSGLVAQRREAKQVLYRLADERTTATVRFVDAVFGRGEEPLNALKALERTGAVEVGAPGPASVRSAAMFAIVERS